MGPWSLVTSPNPPSPTFVDAPLPNITIHIELHKPCSPYWSVYTVSATTAKTNYPREAGRIYILRIEPPPRYNHETSSWTADKEEEYGGSVLTYYNCLEDESKITVFFLITTVLVFIPLVLSKSYSLCQYLSESLASSSRLILWSITTLRYCNNTKQYCNAFLVKNDKLFQQIVFLMDINVNVRLG